MSLNEKSPMPPVTKTQSLADILNEIESRANRIVVFGECHIKDDCVHADIFVDEVKVDLPKLVKALRRADEVISECDPDTVFWWSQEVAAILTSPENGEQQSQSLGEP